MGRAYARLRRLSWVSAVCVGAAVGLVMAAAAAADRVLHRPFASDPGARLVAVFAHHTATAREHELTSFVTFTDWQVRATSFDRLSGYRLATVNLVGEPEPASIVAALVARDFFETLGVHPALGRAFVPEESEPDRGRVAIISDSLWRTRFGGRTSVVGSTIRLEGISGSDIAGTMTIVGVAPPAFRYPERVDVWMPYTPSGCFATNRSGQWFGVVGRLRADVTLDAATAEMHAVMRQVQAEYPKVQPPHTANLVPLRDVLTSGYRLLIAGLGAAAGLLLLVVAASMGGVLAARALREQRHEVIRLSLGASQSRLLADAAREGGGLGLLAFVVAIPVALACLAAFGVSAREVFDVPLDVHLSAFSLFAGLSSALIVAVGVAVAVKGHALRRATHAGLRLANPGVGGARETTRLRRVLIVGEIALTVVLLTAGSDLLRRVVTLRAVDLGMDVERVLTIRLALPSSRYAGERSSQFFTTLIDRVRALPSVMEVAAASDDPLFGVSSNPEFTLQLEDRTLAPEERVPVLVNGVTERYFDVVRIPIVDGHTPGGVGGGEGPLSATVNRSFALRLFPDVNPIGRRFRFGGRNPPWWTIVGIAADARNDGPTAAPRPTVYMRYPGFGKPDMTLLVRMRADESSVVPDIRAIVSSLDPHLPLGRIASATGLVEARFAGLRIAASIVGMLATAALMLSGLGLYSVLAATAIEARTEIGLRMALGASPGDMMWLIAGRAAALACTGVLLGTACSVGLALSLRTSVLVTMPNPTQIVGLVAMVAFVSLVAAVWPCWLALTVRPIDALRAE